MVGGYMGKILNVDLSSGTISEEELDEKILKDFVGGAGLGARLIFSRQKGRVDPLGPENTLGFVTGPFTGTPVPYGGRYQVIAKSPLTGCWGDANSGGEFGPRLKFAGFDAVFFTGTSEKPVYLLIDNGKAELRDAGHLWGKDTFETEDVLKAELGRDTEVSCVGPAGEKLAFLACPINNKGRAPARSGMGAVMGSKRLKAIAVRGSMKVPVADRDKLTKFRRRLLDGVNDSIYYPVFRMHSNFGNVGLLRSWGRYGGTPSKNYAGVCAVDFPDVDDVLGVRALMPYQQKKEACWGCPCGCGGRLIAGVGEYEWEAGASKPEYESLAFGFKCQNRNIESVIKACDICNRYGLDHSSTAATISFAIECYENGLINLDDTGGIELTWGNHRSIVAITDLLAKREGFGDVLADGVKVAAERIGKGAEQYAMHTHGQEIDSTGPLPWPGWALGYVIDATPGRHTVGNTGFAEVGPPPKGLGFNQLVPHLYTGKGEANRRLNAFHNLLNATGVCQFSAYHGVIDGETMPEFFKLVTGWDFTPDDIFEIGDRIATIRMAFTLREGINPIEDFKLPGRIIGHPPMTKGPQQWVEIDLRTMVKEYLEAMDWEQGTCMPSKRRLQQLGLEDVAEALGIE